MVQPTKIGKYTKMGKYTQMTQKIPNSHKNSRKIDQNISTSSIARPSKINPNLDICIENMPSGNPASRYVEFLHN
jgi:hypothetical protein